MSDVKSLVDLQSIPASAAQHCCDASEPGHLIEDGQVPLAEDDSGRRDRQTQAFPATREREERVQRAIVAVITTCSPDARARGARRSGMLGVFESNGMERPWIPNSSKSVLRP